MTESLEESRAQSRSQNDDHKYICPNCGYESNAKFCVKCGTALSKEITERENTSRSIRKRIAAKSNKKKRIIVSGILVLCIVGVVFLIINTSATHREEWGILSYEIPNGLKIVTDSDTAMEYEGDGYQLKLFMYESGSTLGSSDEWLETARSVMNDKEPIMIGSVSGVKGAYPGSVTAAFSWNDIFIALALHSTDGEVSEQQNEFFNEFLDSVDI